MFVSHSSKDREAANTIVDAVEQAGFPCWIAPRNISPGSDYDEEIVSAIESGLAMLLIVSPRSGESRHVKRELELAGEEGRSVVPVLIDGDGIPRVSPCRCALGGCSLGVWLAGQREAGAETAHRAVNRPALSPMPRKNSANLTLTCDSLLARLCNQEFLSGCTFAVHRYRIELQCARE